MTATLRSLGKGAGAGRYYIASEQQKSRRDEYYLDGQSGTWWGPLSSLVEHGSKVNGDIFQKLCEGIHPTTGKALISASGRAHRAGWDLTLSAPKSFSVLWAAGTAEQRRLLDRLNQEAVDETLAMICQERLLSIRLGAGGARRVDPKSVVVAKFPHYTSREGDPACHVHCIIVNAAELKDQDVRLKLGRRGKWRSIEIREAFVWQLSIGSAYRAALSKRLWSIGLRTQMAGRDQFEIVGVDERLISKFSKRSRQIESVVSRDASARSKERANLATRARKGDVPDRKTLEERWGAELLHIDPDPWKSAQSKAREREETPSADVISFTSLIPAAAKSLFETRSVVSRKDMLHKAFANASLCGIGIQETYHALELATSERELLRLDQCESPQYWTTELIATQEAELLRALSSQSKKRWISPGGLRSSMDAQPILSDEQLRALEVLASEDSVCFLQAGAGTGKTTLLRSLTQAARESGRECIALAPSWVAADELSSATGIEAVAIARFLHDIETGMRKRPGPNSVVIVDEVGMCGTLDAAAICRAMVSAESGGRVEIAPKLICVGDARQLASIAGGNLPALISDQVSRQATISWIRRQEVEWQRVASMAMAQGNAEAGLREYIQNGCVELHEGDASCKQRVIELWKEYRKQYGNDIIVVTRRNRDAAELNRMARSVLRAEGGIRGSDVLLRSLNQANDALLIEIAVGDLLRFGETLQQHGIRNGTRATVEGCWGDPDDPFVAVKLLSGRVITDRWHGFANGRRIANAGIPKVTHGIAGSVYSAQGRTTEAAILYLAARTDAREIYVGLTRHRKNARIVVESTRISEAYQSPDSTAYISNSEAVDHLCRESGRYYEKSNVIDFVADRKAFQETGVVVIPEPARHFVRITAEAARLIRAAHKTLDGAKKERKAKKLSSSARRLIYSGIESIVRTASVLKRIRLDPHLRHPRDSASLDPFR